MTTILHIGLFNNADIMGFAHSFSLHNLAK